MAALPWRIRAFPAFPAIGARGAISLAPSRASTLRNRKFLAMAAAQGDRPNPWRFIRWRRANDEQVMSKQGDKKKGDFGYKVIPGETLHDIAAKFKTRVEILMEANDILNPQNIAAGEHLWIPKTYEIVTGDTLYSLSRKFGTKVSAIQAANGIDDPELIYIGDVIIVPDEEENENE
ncbi:uncharacterized protein LOC9651880 isoform X1 [Selaginella moellendorffii]|nr:uncharacterized protein LOC9651880 isoform X1 [Selaginella moellendorffii]|eukprot:XP_002987873.2 uncharacterized protein LOC9651880 isoform X1 [Selaginella moellendorffii]